MVKLKINIVNHDYTRNLLVQVLLPNKIIIIKRWKYTKSLLDEIIQLFLQSKF